MRFYLGETFAAGTSESRQLAMVVALESDGRKAKLRIFDTNEEFIADWNEFQRHRNWQRVVSSDRDQDEGIPGSAL